ncbi:tRNA (guanine(9)-N(1))-methyltransferase [Theileria orientalis]|uniref:tRNA (guanine(9)-N(1))-methyltransferase n=1 Tax=Theileria orientalis TaxID=68886 RepID=A0A976QQN3_THEOR|nr:tRNA (guanine(9)-N(1))-methyltransferase [Theileria orientalis]
MTRESKLLKKSQFVESCKLNPIIVIDCEFTDYASEKESRSLANQIMQSYGANKRAPKPFNLVICGIKENSFLDDALRRISGTQNWSCLLTHQPLDTLFNSDDLTYLSADSSDILSDLVPSGIYVIGGIVDRNRLDGITYNKARIIGAKCQRLPIREHLKLSGSHILSVNTCVNILLDFYVSRDWESSLRSCIPSRKL